MFSNFRAKLIFIFSIVLLCNASVFAQPANEAELKKQAAQHFEDEEYGLAYKEYSQLVSNYPKDPVYNYRLGVCMLFTEPDKKKCFSYLEIANKNIDDSEKEARFYLAKAYHINFRFDEAIKLYTQYKDIASASMVKKLKVDKEIQACKNGKRLLSDLNELVVLEKKQLPQGDYYRSYNLSSIGGKLLVKPADFTSPVDKKKKDKSIVYLPKKGDVVYYASYGNGENKDIFIRRRLPNGDWGPPENIGAPVNTEFDEDYPFLHPNGKVLYFASQGHNSMGGYDIFKSEYDEANKRWRTPVNMDFPINTPNDEILFVTDSLEKTAYFSSTRQSPYGKIDVFKVNTERRPPEFIYIKGSVLKKTADQSVNSKFTVKDTKSGNNIGTFQADQAGGYLIKIPNGGKFIFTVETPGFTTQSEGVEVPVSTSLTPYKQFASYQSGKLTFQNFFEVKKGDENSYQQNLEIIEQKSKLDVNASDFTSTPITATTTTTTTSGSTDPKTNPNTDPKTNPKSNLDNTQLEKIAFEEATELKNEAIKLKEDANDAFTFVQNKKFEASQKNKEALDALDAANNEKNSAKKEALQTKANELKEEAEKQDEQAKLAENIARQLETDANNKQKEADLQQKYAEQLKEVNATKNNKEALAKLESIQKELEALSKEKSNVNELSNSINADIKRKDAELKKLEPIITKNKNEVADLEAEAKNLDLEIDNTKEKDLKKNLMAQKEELMGELATKKNELKANEDKQKFIANEKEALISQADFATNMISAVKENGDVAAISSTTSTSDGGNPATTSTSTGGNGSVDFATTKTKNEEKIKALNSEPASVKRYEEQKQLNSEVIAATNTEITNKKNALANAKTSDEKKKLSSEINELEKLKTAKEAEDKIYDNKIAQQKTIESSTASTSTTGDGGSNPSTTNPSGEINNLNALNNVGNNGQELFNNSNYKNTEAITLKQKAEADYNASIKKSESLSNQINELKNTDNSSSEDYSSRATKLNAEIDQLTAEAAALRKEAKTLNGDAQKSKISQAKEKEALAANKRYELAVLTSKENDAQFELNQKIIDEYKAANGGKTNADITKATNLINESSTLYKQALKIEEEANAEQDVAAKAAAYTNAEEKEVAALAKQEEAIALYKKSNPSYTPTSTRTSGGTGVSDGQISSLKAEIEKKNKGINNSLSTLAEANKKEYTTQLIAAKNNSSGDAKRLVAEAEQLKNKAEEKLNAASSASSSSDQNMQLVEANKLYQAAIAKLSEAGRNSTTGTGTDGAVTTTTVTPRDGSTTTTGTVTPRDGGAASTATLTPSEVAKIKETPEYKTYAKLNSDAAKYNDAAVKEETKVTELRNEAMNNLKRSNDLRIEADKMPDGPAKKAKQEEAARLERNANAYKAKGDSVNELAINTRAFADSKKMEAESFGSTLDPVTFDKIQTVAGTKNPSTTTSTTVTPTTTTSTTVTPTTTSGTQDLNLSGVSEDFKSEKENIESNLSILNAAPETQDNLKAKNELLAQYNYSIDNEIEKEKNKLATASPAQKTIINNNIKSLEAKKASNTKLINANRTKIKNGGGTTVPTNPVVTTTTSTVSTSGGTTPPDVGSNGSPNGTALKGNGFEIKSTSAYSASNPIPVDEKLPGGIIFAVQIGAFKLPIPNDLFKGLSPLRGETTNQGFIRYQAGRFTKFEIANGVKNDLKKLGYKDAFVVVYKDGQKIPLGQAFNELKSQGIPITINPNETANITATTNIRPASEVNAILGNNAMVATATPSNTTPAPTKEIKDVQGLLFTVQIGVYNNNASAAQLNNLKPIYKEQIDAGYRYTAGIYNNLDKVKADRLKVNQLGIKDAFVSAYLNGTRIKVADAVAKINSGNVQFPPENPIQFGGATTSAVANTPVVVSNTPTVAVQPFNNGVTQGPKPTAENGVKVGDAGITFKVQIGAYKNQVPANVANNFFKIKDWPIQAKQINGLFIYTIGSFVDAKSARPLVEKAKQNGIGDAFISVYKDGVKLYGAEAAGYLGR